MRQVFFAMVKMVKRQVYYFDKPGEENTPLVIEAVSRDGKPAKSKKSSASWSDDFPERLVKETLLDYLRQRFKCSSRYNIVLDFFSQLHKISSVTGYSY